MQIKDPVMTCMTQRFLQAIPFYRTISLTRTEMCLRWLHFGIVYNDEYIIPRKKHPFASQLLPLAKCELKGTLALCAHTVSCLPLNGTDAM